jgi:hypothetical protein
MSPSWINKLQDRLRTFRILTTRLGNTRPNCTHVTMDMSYLVSPCDICGEYPTLGWLYQCNQDDRQEASIKLENERLEIMPSDSLLVLELKSLGFSQSIIDHATTGHYTEAQLDILKVQKSKVMSNIVKKASSQPGSAESNASNVTETLHPNITTRKPKHTKRRRPIPNWPVAVKCSLKCCHVRPIHPSKPCCSLTNTDVPKACRPYYRDRVFGSLTGIVNDLDTAWAHHDMTGAPVLDSSLVRQLGLRKPAVRPARKVNPSLDSCESWASSEPESWSADAPELYGREDFDTHEEWEAYLANKLANANGVSAL